MKRFSIIAILLLAALQTFGAEISWNGETYPVIAYADGRWEIEFPAMPAGGPYAMKVGNIELNDILIGDVFLCSGQSNMELPVRRVTDMFAEEIAGYENNFIRQYFGEFSGMPVPAYVEQPERPLEELKAIKLDMKHHN